MKIVKIDEKADKDTKNGCNHPDGSMVEIIIDTKLAKVNYQEAIIMGNFNYSDIFNGTIIDIEKVNIKK